MVMDKINIHYSPRSHLGLSEIGHKCDRYIYNVHNNVPCMRPDERLLRIFKLGNAIEDLIIEDLRTAYDVFDCQKEIFIEHNGSLIKGHIDGIIYINNIPHLLEIKSASKSRFNQLKKCGYEEWSETYKAQIHTYCTICELSKIFVIVYNKDNSDIYEEFIDLNISYAIDVMKRAISIIGVRQRPKMLCPNAGFYRAKMCKFQEECFKNVG